MLSFVLIKYMVYVEFIRKISKQKLEIPHRRGLYYGNDRSFRQIKNFTGSSF